MSKCPTSNVPYAWPVGLCALEVPARVSPVRTSREDLATGNTVFSHPGSSHNEPTSAGAGRRLVATAPAFFCSAYHRNRLTELGRLVGFAQTILRSIRAGFLPGEQTGL
jgi:hypothetical protein